MSARWIKTLALLVGGLLLGPLQAWAATYAFQSSTYSWETAATDIVWDQTQTLYPRDDDKQVINIGFTFNFAGVNYTQVRVHSNGALQFGADTQFHRQFTNTDLPVTSAPPSCGGCTAGVPADRLMLIYWDDINPRLGGTVRYETKGTAPNRRLVVSWESVPHYNLAGTYSFQVILYESGQFIYQYGTGNASGVSATIGTEVNDSDYTLYSFNSSYSYSGTAIRWFKPTGEPVQLAEYRFEESVLNGTVNEVIDWSGNGYFGQAAGTAAAEANGYICRGVRIPLNTTATSSAVNTNLDVDAAIGKSGSLTFWYRADSAWDARDNQLLDASTENNRWFFLVKRKIRSLRFVMTDGSGTHAIAETPAQTVLANTWKHIAVTWRFAAGSNQTVLRIYVDGLQSVVTQTTTDGTLPSSLGTLFVGDNRSSVTGQNGTLTSAEGTFDSLRVYNYEISNADVQLDRLATHPCVVVDHIRILHDGAGLTCNPKSVTLQACADSLCSTQYTGSVSATLRLNGAPVATTSFTGGSGSVSFNQFTAGTFTLDALGTAPPSTGLSDCRLGAVSNSCAISFADSGFIFDVPNLLANKPSGNLSFTAVRKDDASQLCVPAFKSVTRNVQFWSGYSNPATGTRSVSVNGTAVSGSSPGSSVSLAFDANARANINVQYSDAGQMSLDAKYTGNAANGDAGLLMSGTDSFVARPAGLCVYSDTANSDCVSGNASCSAFVAAGDPFRLGIRAAAWQADVDADMCVGNGTTPNYRQTAIALTSTLVAPIPGSAATLGISSVDLAAGDAGEKMLTTQRASEVGVFKFSATPPVATSPLTGYFGDTVTAGTSVNVGRFIPAYLSASASASLTPSCGSAFSYQGQPMAFAVGQEPALTVTGYNRTGGVTSNYDRGAFWRLATPARNAYVSATGKSSLDASGRLTSVGSASLSQSGVDNGDGAQSYRWSGETLSYTPATLPLADDLPFTAALSQSFSAAALTDADGACNGVGSGCLPYSYNFANTPGSAVRLGRLRIGNAHGSELQALSLPLTLESWQSTAGGSFQPEGLDTCTNAAVLGAPLLSGFTGNLAMGETTPSLVWPVVGSRSLLLSAPGAGNDGSVQATLTTLPTWLYYDWNGSGRNAAKGLASFGIYAGPKPLIFRRELYR